MFVPRREHARFCSRRCRAAWYRDQFGDVTVGPSTLEWSISAMRDSTGRLAESGVWDLPRAYGAIDDAVWRVTMLDAALVRYHPRAYDEALHASDAAARLVVEETLAGLRLVRNRTGEGGYLTDFVEPERTGPGPITGPILGWVWKPVSEPAFGSRTHTTQTWEWARYRSYQTRLAEAAVGATFGLCEQFLATAAAGAMATAADDRQSAL
jgi:hypothetical protein